jgi:hypothetical protein
MIKISGDRFTFVEHPTGEGHLLSLAEAGLREVEHLREYIARSPAVFFGELEQDLLIIDTEVPLAEGRLIADILAVDRDGAVVIVELKRNADRDQHLSSTIFTQCPRARFKTSVRVHLPALAGRLQDQSGKEENRDFRNSTGNGASPAGGPEWRELNLTAVRLATRR